MQLSGLIRSSSSLLLLLLLLIVIVGVNYKVKAFQQQSTSNLHRRKAYIVPEKKKNHRHDYNNDGLSVLFGKISDLEEGRPNEKMNYLEEVTQKLLNEPAGSLTMGKWHEIVSIMTAWSKQTKTRSNNNHTPIIVETLLKRLIDEREAGNTNVQISTDIYNLAISTWADMARTVISKNDTFLLHSQQQQHTNNNIYRAAAERAQDIVKHMHSFHEIDPHLYPKPDVHSFHRVLGAWTKASTSYARIGQNHLSLEAASSAKDFLSWIISKHPEYAKDVIAYSHVMNAYAQSRAKDAGPKAESLLQTLIQNGGYPNTFCYNIVINAYTQQQQQQQQQESSFAVDNVERLLHQMETIGDPDVLPDVVSYTSVVTAWANSNRKTYGAKRAQSILEQMTKMNVQPNTVTYNAVLKAWLRSGNSKAPEKAHGILTEMETLHKKGVAQVKPNLITYNTHIHILSKTANSQDAQRAEQILLDMERGAAEGKLDFSPNLFSYNTVIQAWSKASNSERAFAILNRLLSNQQISPDSFSFNSVVFAISKSKLPNAATRAQEVLEYMEKVSLSGDDRFSKVSPDVYGYTSVINTWSKSGRHDAGYKAEILLRQMEIKYQQGNKNLKPNTITYNSVMNAWTQSNGGTLGARKAEALFQEMNELWRSGQHDLQPNVSSYNTLLAAWARSGTKCAYRKTEALLNQMWKDYEAGNIHFRPDSSSYNTVINAISKSQAEGKAQKALRMLRKMDKLYRAGRNEDACPNEFSYTSVLNSCAFAVEVDARGRSRALDTAIFTLKELKNSHYGDPNHITYGTYFKACANLLSIDDERRRVCVEPVFLQCIRDGQCGEIVLTHLRDAAPSDLYEKLLGEFIVSDAISVQDLPLEWRCNVVEPNRGNKYFSRRRNQSDGRTRSGKVASVDEDRNPVPVKLRSKGTLNHKLYRRGLRP